MATVAETFGGRIRRDDLLSGTPRAHAIDRWIFVAMAAWFIAIVLAGFIPDSLMKIEMVRTGQRPPFPLVLHMHAVLMGSFLLLLLAPSVARAQDGPRGQGNYVDGPRKSFAGGAGLLSTARDYARFLEMTRNGGVLEGVRILSPRTVALMTTNQKTARRKGFTAAAVAGTSALLLGSAPVLGIVGLVGAGYLCYDWVMFRAKNGMRF